MTESMQTITVEFVGPFSWCGGSTTPTIREAAAGKKSGVYVWTVDYEQAELVYLWARQAGASLCRAFLAATGAKFHPLKW